MEIKNRIKNSHLLNISKIKLIPLSLHKSLQKKTHTWNTVNGPEPYIEYLI